MAVYNVDHAKLQHEAHQIDLFVALAWENELSFHRHESRQYQSAVRSLLAIFYSHIDGAGFTDSRILRTPAMMKEKFAALIDATWASFQPRGLTASETETAFNFLNVCLSLMSLIFGLTPSRARPTYSSPGCSTITSRKWLTLHWTCVQRFFGALQWSVSNFRFSHVLVFLCEKPSRRARPFSMFGATLCVCRVVT
jgi:hypothetical protein